MGGDDAAVERADVGQQGWRAHPVAVEHDGTLGLRLREVDLEERVAPLRLGGDLAQPLGRHGVGGVRPEAEVQPVRRARPSCRTGWQASASISSQRWPGAVGVPGTSKMPGVKTPRMPAASRASITGSGVPVLLAGRGDAVGEQLGGTERHAPVDVLVLEPRLAGPDRFAQPAVERQPVPCAAHERHRRVPVAVHQPGHEHAAELAHLGAGRRRDLRRVTDPRDQPVGRPRPRPGARTVSSASTVKTASATSRRVTARRRTSRPERSRETRSVLVATFHRHLHGAVGVAPAHERDRTGDEAAVVEQRQRPQVQLDLLADAQEPHPLPHADLGQWPGRDGRRGRVRARDRVAVRAGGGVARAVRPAAPRRRRRSRAPSAPPHGAPCATRAR